MKVLVVEDDLLQAFDIMDVLAAGGHSPIGPAFDSMGAMHFAVKEEPDLALVDLTLSGGDQGQTVVQDLYDRFNIPAIFLTASCRQARACRTRALGCIQKPVHGALLLRSVELAGQIVAGRQPNDVPSNVEFYG